MPLLLALICLQYLNLHSNYYAYFTPIREYMPQNCTSDIEAVIAYLDQIYAENNTAAIQNMKDAFGLGGLSHIDDFAAAREFFDSILSSGSINMDNM